MMTSLCLLITVFSKEDKVLIKSLYELKGYNDRQFMTMFPNKGWKKISISRLLQKLRHDGREDSDLKQGLMDTRHGSNTLKNIQLNYNYLFITTITKKEKAELDIMCTAC